MKNLFYRLTSILAQALRFFCLGLIWWYQRIISPVWHTIFGSAVGCRFTPSCSEYARLSFKHHPPLKALWLTLKRIGKCHPGHAGGIDPIPAHKDI